MDLKTVISKETVDKLKSHKKYKGTEEGYVTLGYVTSNANIREASDWGIYLNIVSDGKVTVADGIVLSYIYNIDYDIWNKWSDNKRLLELIRMIDDFGNIHDRMEFIWTLLTGECVEAVVKSVYQGKGYTGTAKILNKDISVVRRMCDTVYYSIKKSKMFPYLLRGTAIDKSIYLINSDKLSVNSKYRLAKIGVIHRFDLYNFFGKCINTNECIIAIRNLAKYRTNDILDLLKELQEAGYIELNDTTESNESAEDNKNTENNSDAEDYSSITKIVEHTKSKDYGKGRYYDFITISIETKNRDIMNAALGQFVNEHVIKVSKNLVSLNQLQFSFGGKIYYSLIISS